jgi:hypothetical protein
MDGQAGRQNDRRTDKHDEVSSQSSQFCERAQNSTLISVFDINVRTVITSLYSIKSLLFITEEMCVYYAVHT